MGQEHVALLAAFAALTIAGAPVVMASLKAAPRPVAQDPVAQDPAPQDPVAQDIVLALAPGAGVAVFALLAWPLYRLLGASAHWGLPAALVMILGALLASIALARRAGLRPPGAALGALVVTLVAVSACLLAPAVFGGFDRVVFNGNPSDTMMYLSLAESTRSASYEQLREGAAYAVTAGSQALIEHNPVALYSSRFVGVSARLATMIDLGWFAQASGVPVERGLWVFATVMSLAGAAAAYGVARLAQVPRWAAGLIAAVIVLGFWGAMPREGDAYSQLQALPVMLVLVAMRVVIARYQSSLALTSLASAVMAAAYLVIYPEFLPLLAGALAGEYFVHLITRPGRRLATLREGALFAAAIVLLLLATGQLSALIDVLANQFRVVSNAKAPVGSFFYEGQAAQAPIVTIAGLPWLADSVSRIGVSQAMAQPLVLAMALACLVACAIVALDILRRRQDLTIIVASAAVGLAVALYGLLLKHDAYIFQQAMVSAAPAALLLLILAPSLPARQVARPVTAVAALTLAMQLTYAGAALIRDVGGGSAAYVKRYHVARSYDLTEMSKALGETCRGCRLLVYVPPAQDWWWAMFVALSTREYRPYYQMGHFFDNKPATLIFPALTPDTRPDYALVDACADYVSSAKLGELVVERSGLRLYRITAGAVADFAPRPVDPDHIAPAPMETAQAAPDLEDVWTDIEHPEDRSPVVGATRRPLAAARIKLLPHRRVTVVFRDLAVEPGDTVTVAVQAWSRRPAQVRLILARHCNQEIETPDSSYQDLTTTAKPSRAATQVTFTHHFDCIRADVLNITDDRAELFLTAPVVARRAAR